MSKFDKVYEIFQLVVFWVTAALVIGSYLVWFLHLQEQKAERKIWEIENCSWEEFRNTPPKAHYRMFIECRKVWR